MGEGDGRVSTGADHWLSASSSSVAAHFLRRGKKLKAKQNTLGRAARPQLGTAGSGSPFRAVAIPTQADRSQDIRLWWHNSGEGRVGFRRGNGVTLLFEKTGQGSE